MHNRLAQLQQPTLDHTPILINEQPLRSRTRTDALRDALRGLRDAWQTQPNFRLQVDMGIGAVILGVIVRLSLIEWLWISFAIGLVIFAELMNTAIEQTVDLVVGLHPDPLARQVKNMAAGCVLVAALIAVVIGGLTFIPHLIRV